LPDGAVAPASGFLEIRAGTTPSWFTFLSATPPQEWFRLPAGQLVDTHVAVRPGDRVRVAAGGEAIYWLNSRGEDAVIYGNHYREEAVGKSGTVRLKGGLLNSAATVTVLARGSGWK
jgi:hypothetical protein